MPKPIRKTSDCPECGSDELELYRKSWEKNDVLVWCKRCGHEGPKADAMVEAIREWNKSAGETEHTSQESLKMILSEAFESEEVRINYLDNDKCVHFVWMEKDFRAVFLSDGKIMVEEKENMFLKSNRTTQALELFLNYVQDHG